jgi:hypothetical protein
MTTAGPEVPGVASLDADPARRLAGLEEKVRALEAPKKKSRWEIFEILLPLMQAALLALLGWYLTDRVSSALEREKLDLSSASEMRDLLVHLRAPEKPGDAEASAMTLAAFGRPAVAPLLVALDGAWAEGRDDTGIAVERALAALSWSAPAAVCEPLSRVLADRTRSFHWRTHVSSALVIGRAGCADRVPLLRAYAREIAAPDPETARLALERRVSDMAPPGPGSVVTLRSALEATLAVLEREEGP